MNKSLKILLVATVAGTFLISSCKTPAQKRKCAQKNVKSANTDLEKANAAYLKDIEDYKKANQEKIDANNKSISELNARIATEKAETREEYKEKIAKLDKKNTDLKKRMDDYKADGKDNWNKFKTEFSHDMDELGKAFKDLTVNNIK